MKKGDKVTWVDGLGYERKGTVDSTDDGYMIAVLTYYGDVLRIRYADLHLVSEEEV